MHASVSPPSSASCKGSLFGKNIIAAGFLDLGYDASIRDGGEGCPPLEPGDIPRIR